MRKEKKKKKNKKEKKRERESRRLARGSLTYCASEAVVAAEFGAMEHHNLTSGTNQSMKERATIQ